MAKVTQKCNSKCCFHNCQIYSKIHPIVHTVVQDMSMGSVLNIMTAINENNVASNRQLLIIVIVIHVFKKDSKGGFGSG